MRCDWLFWLGPSSLTMQGHFGEPRVSFAAPSWLSTRLFDPPLFDWRALPLCAIPHTMTNGASCPQLEEHRTETQRSAGGFLYPSFSLDAQSDRLRMLSEAMSGPGAGWMLAGWRSLRSDLEASPRLNDERSDRMVSTCVWVRTPPLDKHNASSLCLKLHYDHFYTGIVTSPSSFCQRQWNALPLLFRSFGRFGFKASFLGFCFSGVNVSSPVLSYDALKRQSSFPSRRDATDQLC